MIDHAHDLPLSRQAKVLGISRSGVYYLPRAVPAADLVLMRAIDVLHLEYPFAGSRMLQGLLEAVGQTVGRHYVASLMKRMGIETLYPRQSTSKPAPWHKIFHLSLAQAAGDATQSGLSDGHHLHPDGAGLRLSDGRRRQVQPQGPGPAALDHHGHRLPHEAVEEAMARFGKPDIFNTDQGSQFTSRAFTALPIGAGIRISMDGKGAWRDNVFVERIWNP